MDEPVTEDSMSAEEDTKAYEQFMQKPTTVPTELVITLTNFADEQDAQRCGGVVRSWLEVFGRFMDLSRLEHVYVTFDYEGTLAAIDSGTGTGNTYKPTNDDIATGVAMAPSVLREDGWKSIIVINAGFARSLYYEEEGLNDVSKQHVQNLRDETIHILAHECGHVHDHAMETQNLPAESYSQKWTALEYRLKQPARACWSEYIAEFLSANFGTKDTLANYEKAFCDRLKAAWPAITASIRQYRMHGDVEKVISKAGLHIKNVIVYAAYMLGQLSKKDISLDIGVPTAMQTAKEHQELGSYLERVQDVLYDLHDQYPAFTSLDVFNPLSDVVHDMYKTAGLTFTENADGTLRVDIPFREDTMPSISEQIDFVAAREAQEAASDS